MSWENSDSDSNDVVIEASDEKGYDILYEESDESDVIEESSEGSRDESSTEESEDSVIHPESWNKAEQLLLRFVNTGKDKSNFWLRASCWEEISIDFIKAHRYFEWNISMLTKRFDFKTISENMNMKWDFKTLSCKDVPIEFIVKYKTSEWNWDILTQKFPFETLLQYVYLRWQFSNREDINIDRICKIITENGENCLNFHTLSSKIPIDDILSHSNLPWNWYLITSRVVATTDWNIILANPSLKWDWNELSQSVPWSIIENNLMPWNFHYVSLNPTITWEIILNYPDPSSLTTMKKTMYINWNYGCLGKTVHIPIDFVLENFHKYNWSVSLIDSDKLYTCRREYIVIIELLSSLQIFSNGCIPKYLMMEILENECKYLSSFQLMHLIA